MQNFCHLISSPGSTAATTPPAGFPFDWANFPIWWELMPAMMKGFIDKVIFPGVTLITTMNSAPLVYRLVFGNAVKKALFAGTFWKMGYRYRKWINFGMVKFVSQEKREGWLAQMTRRFSDLCAA